MQRIAIARVSTDDQDLFTQQRQILQHLQENNITGAVVHSLKSSGFSENESVNLIKDTQVSTVYVTEIDRLSRCIWRLSKALSSRGSGCPLTVVEILTNKTYTLPHYIPTSWPAEFLQKIETAERSSVEKSEKTKRRHESKRRQLSDVYNNSPKLIKVIEKAIRGSEKIYGRRNKSSIGGFVKRKAKKNNLRISVKNIGNLIKVVSEDNNFNKNCPVYSICCSRCNKFKNVYKPVYERFRDNLMDFDCRHINHTDCTSSEFGENDPVTDAMDDINLNSEIPDGFHSIERIIDSKIVENKYTHLKMRQFKVKWEGHPESEATWEPYTNLVVNPRIHDKLIEFFAN
jgi:hypothetical protein